MGVTERTTGWLDFSGQEVEITPEMLDAGATAIGLMLLVQGPREVARELAAGVFRVMRVKELHQAEFYDSHGTPYYSNPQQER